MATGLISKAKVHAGALIVGGVPSDGGAGAIGGTGTPVIIKKIAKVVTASQTLGTITPPAVFTANITVTGAKPGDIIVANPNYALATTANVDAWVSANDTVVLNVSSGTGAAITPGNGTFTILWISIV